MTSAFFKFPSTSHLAVLPGASVRDAKVFSKQEQCEFLSHDLVIEEKIDGANLGISFDSDGNLRVQNRGSFLALPSPGQWKPLASWLDLHRECLFDVLTDRYLLFGEWCYATHSISYDRLPDWFLGFDLFDTQAERFVNTVTRDQLFERLKISSVPFFGSGRFTLDEAVGFLGQSRFGSVPSEGLYLRYDDGGWIGDRAKVVRPGFIQSIEQHWSRGPLRLNSLLDATEPVPSESEDADK